MTIIKGYSPEIKQLVDTELLLIKPLFEAVFKASVDLDFLRWKYAQGRGISWVVCNEDLLLLHCGVCFRDVYFRGERTQGAQLVDLMAAPKQAGLSRSHSPFGLLMRHVLSTLSGPLNPDGLAFGFPSARAMQLGERLGVYTSVDDWFELQFRPKAVRPGPQAQQICTWGASEMATVEKLWTNMRRDLTSFAVCSRDFDYIRHRFLEHPTRRYTLLLVRSRWRRIPLGLVVLSLANAEYELVDVVSALDDVPDVLSAVQYWLAQVGGTSCCMMLTSTFALKFSVAADQVRPTQFRIMANPQMPSDALTELRQRWWLTGGDTDYR